MALASSPLGAPPALGPMISQKRLWFGGFLPLIATAVTSSAWAKASFGSGAIYTGLMYPIGVCVITLIVGGLYIHETKDHKIDADLHM